MGLKNWIIGLIAKRAAKELDLKEGPVDTKQWWKSKGFWSNVVIIGIGVYELVRANAMPALPPIPPVLLTILGSLGLYSRATATKPLGA